MYKVLIIEPEPVNRIMFEGTLGDDCFELLFVQNSSEAIETAASIYIDLMITDMSDQDNDALQAVRTVSMSDPDVPIIALVPENLYELKKTVFHNGANKVLVKPFDIQDLLNVMDMLLGIGTVPYNR